MSAAVSPISVRIAASAASPSRAAMPSRIARWSGSARRREVGDDVVYLERRAEDGAEHGAQVSEQLVVAGGEDPLVEEQVGGEVGRLVLDACVHRLVGLPDRFDLLVVARTAESRAA